MKTNHESTDETKHPLWAVWLAWYGDTYTTFIPMHEGRPANLDTLLSWETWKAAQPKHSPSVDEIGDVMPPPPDLNRKWKFREDCTCGCNTPSFTEPLGALRFLMRRMQQSGLAHSVCVDYAWDIMQILKKWDAVESGEIGQLQDNPAPAVPQWTRFADAHPKDCTPILWRPSATDHGLGLGYYTTEDKTGWPDDHVWVTYEDLALLTVK